MQDHQFRYVSLGALVLVAAGLLGGTVVAVSALVNVAVPSSGLSVSFGIISHFI